MLKSSQIQVREIKLFDRGRRPNSGLESAMNVSNAPPDVVGHTGSITGTVHNPCPEQEIKMAPHLTHGE